MSSSNGRNNREHSPSPTSTASEFPSSMHSPPPKKPPRDLDKESDHSGPAFVTPSPTARAFAPSEDSTATTRQRRGNKEEGPCESAAAPIAMGVPAKSRETTTPKAKDELLLAIGIPDRDNKPATIGDDDANVGHNKEQKAAIANKSSSSLKPAPKPIQDEKTRARQARLAAMAQQERQYGGSNSNRRPRAAARISRASLTHPSRHEEKQEEDAATTAAIEEDPDVIAKRRGRAPLTAANVRKLAPAPPTSVLTHRTTTMSSVSTTSSNSTTVTQNTTAAAVAPCLASMQAVSLVLEDDDDDDIIGNVNVSGGSTLQADMDSKRRARASASATGQQQQRLTPATRRHTTAMASADAAVKRNATLTPTELAQRGAQRRRRATHLGIESNSAHSSSSLRRSSGTGLDSADDSHHSTTSSVGAHSVTGGNKASKKSSNNDGDDEEEDAVQQHLSYIASSQYDELSSSRHQQQCGPRLVMPDDHTEYEDSKFGSSTHSTRMKMIFDEAILEEEDDEEFAGNGGDEHGDDVELEAQAGVPVLQIQPGAFAVEGLDATNDAPEEDLEQIARLEGEESGALAQNSHHDATLSDPNSALFFDPEAALDAQLYDDNTPQFLEAELHEDAVLVDACVLTEDPEGLSAKARRRLRFMQCSVFCLALGAIVAVVGVAVRRPGSGGGNPWDVNIPTIEGWDQVGGNLTGPTDDGKSLYGYSISMAGNAERIAIGVPGRDQGTMELQVGEVHMLDWNGTQWLPNGVPLLGPGPDAQAGTAIALSKDGRRVAVGSPFYSHGGYVAVYEETEPQQWDLVGQTLVGDSSKMDSDARFGGALAMSEDGNILVVGAAMGEGGNATDSGFVRIFQLQFEFEEQGPEGSITNSTGATAPPLMKWVQIGDDITGQSAGDFFGWALAANLDGMRIAVGAVGSTGDNVGEFSGQARVFDYDDTSAMWVQTGPSISGLAAFDSFGSSVALSDAGDVLAVGAIGHSTGQDGVDIGHVRIFQFSNNSDESGEKEAWEPLGQSLLGQNAFDSFGFSVSLSSDGKRVAAGGPRNDEFGESSGHIQVFDFDELTSTWNRIGSNIGGSYEGRDLFGWSCALSSDGSRIAGGAPFSTYDGMLSDVGTVRVFDVAFDVDA